MKSLSTFSAHSSEKFLFQNKTPEHQEAQKEQSEQIPLMESKIDNKALAEALILGEKIDEEIKAEQEAELMKLASEDATTLLRLVIHNGKTVSDKVLEKAITRWLNYESSILNGINEIPVELLIRAYTPNCQWADERVMRGLFNRRDGASAAIRYYDKYSSQPWAKSQFKESAKKNPEAVRWAFYQNTLPKSILNDKEMVKTLVLGLTNHIQSGEWLFERYKNEPWHDEAVTRYEKACKKREEDRKAYRASHEKK